MIISLKVGFIVKLSEQSAGDDLKLKKGFHLVLLNELLYKSECLIGKYTTRKNSYKITFRAVLAYFLYPH